jgi:hypothetical protein
MFIYFQQNSHCIQKLGNNLLWVDKISTNWNFGCMIWYYGPGLVSFKVVNQENVIQYWFQHLVQEIFITTIIDQIG